MLVIDDLEGFLRLDRLGDRNRQLIIVGLVEADHRIDIASELSADEKDQRQGEDEDEEDVRPLPQHARTLEPAMASTFMR